MRNTYVSFKGVLCSLATLFCCFQLTASNITVCHENAQVEQIEFQSLSFAQCNTSPVITCPQNYFGCPSESIDPSNTGFATAVPGQAGCSQPDVTYVDIEMSTGPCTGQLFRKRKWTAVYPDGNPWLIAECTQIIMLEDNDAPAIADCPDDITLSPNIDCQAVASWSLPTASDNCGVVSFTSNYNSGEIFGEGSTTITYTATDVCGATTTCSFTVTVEGPCCVAPPTISCPANVELCPGDSVSPSNTGTATASASTACNTPDITYTDDVISSGPCTGARVIERTWTATDPNFSNFTDACIQTITLEDTSNPILSNCPSDIMLSPNNNCEGVATWNAPLANDNCGIASVTSNYDSGHAFDLGTTTVTYIATDNCGNTAACSFDVTVSGSCCFEAPIITCPGDVFLCPGSSIDTADTGVATAVAGSVHCATPIVTFTDQVLSTGNCDDMTIKRVWVATDPNNPNLTAECHQIIALADTQAPIISKCPLDITVASGGECTGSTTWDAPTVIDNCGTPSLSSDISSDYDFPIGTTTVTYTATDDCGNSATCTFTVTVTDNCCDQDPVITCPSDYSACVGTSTNPNTTGSATATNPNISCTDLDITYSDHVVSTGPCTGATVIERTWTASISGTGLSTSCIQMITLADNTDPVLSNCPSDITVASSSTDCVGNANWAIPTATDNCGTPSLSSNYNSSHDFPIGTTTVIYTATDNCGNTASCSFNVIVTDNCCDDSPTITCPADYSACPGSSIDPSVTGTATSSNGNSSCPASVITYTDNVISTGPCSGATVIERTWIATISGTSMSASCTQIITLSDNTNPVLANCPGDITLASNNSDCTGSTTWTAPTATDNCGTPTITSNYSTSYHFPIGTTTVVYTATDACGNTAACSFDVTVTDNCCNDAPVITCPADYTGCVGGSTEPNITGTATSTNSNTHCADADISYTDDVTSTGPCAGATTIIRTWVATIPGTSLSATCTQTITLVDDVAPVIHGCSADLEVVEGDPAIWTEPTATDNCDTAVDLTANHTSGTVFPLGVTNINYTATDDCGNTSICTFTVTVIPFTGINCPDDIVIDCNDTNGAVVTWPTPVLETECNACADDPHIDGFLYMGNYNGHHYYCSTTNATWLNAQAVCEQNGGHLAVINTAGENAFLANQLTIQSAYIGLSDHITEGSFVWANSDELNYTNWYPGQPNNYNGNQDFVEMLNNGQWNDQYVSSALEYIMEIPCNSVVQTEGPLNGTLFPVGTTTVTYQASDACGNTAVCSFDVTVNSAISLDCPNDVTLSCPGSGMIVNWDTPLATSCCNQNCNAGGNIPGFMYMGNHNGHHYYCSTKAATWPVANDICQQNGGYLATIGDATENEFLANILTLQSAYIGLQDADDEGTFTWSNGESLTYTNWYPGQPNDYHGQQDYVEMLNDGQWNDQYNTKALEFIMEIPGCVNVSQSEGPTSGSFFAIGTTSTVSYIATDGCGNTAECSFDITIEQPACNSGGQNTNYSWIESISFNTIHNPSGDNGGYADFTTQCATVSPGQVCPISLNPGFGLGATHVYWKIWVDWNMDGDFTDNGEFIAYGSGASAINGNLQMPYGLWSGTTTMRIAMKKGSYPTGPCENFADGETEDYCINVVGGDIIGDDDHTLSRRDNIEAQELSSTKDALNIEVYPNPAAHEIKVDVDPAHQIQQVRILDGQGKVTKLIKAYEVNQMIDIENLSSGIYYVEVIAEDGSREMKKLIKLR